MSIVGRIGCQLRRIAPGSIDVDTAASRMSPDNTEPPPHLKVTEQIFPRKTSARTPLHPAKRATVARIDHTCLQATARGTCGPSGYGVWEGRAEKRLRMHFLPTEADYYPISLRQ